MKSVKFLVRLLECEKLLLRIIESPFRSILIFSLPDSLEVRMRLSLFFWAFLLILPNSAHSDEFDSLGSDFVWLDVQPRYVRRWAERTPQNNFILDLPVSAPSEVGPAPTCDQVETAANAFNNLDVPQIFRGGGGIPVCFRGIYRMYVTNGYFLPMGKNFLHVFNSCVDLCTEVVAFSNTDLPLVPPGGACSSDLQCYAGYVCREGTCQTPPTTEPPVVTPAPSASPLPPI